MECKIQLWDDDKKDIQKYLEYRNKNLYEGDKPWEVKDVIKVAFRIGMEAMLDNNKLKGYFEDCKNKNDREMQQEGGEDIEI